MAILTVGDLRKIMADLPDDSKIQLEWHLSAGPARQAFPLASDIVPGPAGSDPMTESTVGVLIISAEEEE